MKFDTEFSEYSPTCNDEEEELERVTNINGVETSETAIRDEVELKWPEQETVRMKEVEEGRLDNRTETREAVNKSKYFTKGEEKFSGESIEEHSTLQ